MKQTMMQQTILKQTMMDKCIRANMRLAENEIAVALTMALSIGLCFINLMFIFFVIIPVVISTIFLYKAYKKIFYDSVYGRTATTYQSLPATAAEMTAAKIFVAGLTNLTVTAFTLAMVAAVFAGHGWSGIGNVVMEALSKGFGLNSEGISYTLLLGFLNVVVSSFWQATLIFMVIVVYKSLKIKGRRIPAGLAIAGGFGLNYVITELPLLLTSLDIENIPAQMIFSTTLGLVTMVIMFRITVKLLEEKYEA